MFVTLGMEVVAAIILHYAASRSGCTVNRMAQERILPGSTPAWTCKT
jgi:hypothetical protein